MSKVTRFSVIGFAALALSAGSARAQNGAQSTAVGIDAKLVSHGVASELGPIGVVSGAPSGQYDYVQTIASVNQSLAIAPASLTPTLSVTANGLTSHASSTATSLEARTAEGRNDLRVISLILFAKGPPGSGAPTPPAALQIDGREVLSSAISYSPDGLRRSAVGFASMGSLTVSGQLLGHQLLSFSGEALPNALLFKSPTLTIVLNRQFDTDAIDCSSDCRPGAAGVHATAIDVELHNAPVGGSKVSGHIRINEVIAQ